MEVFNLNLFLSCLVAFFALVNPIHKVFVINTLQNQFDHQSIKYIAIKATITALIILLFFLALGQFVFNYVFHIQLYAFQITCGVVLFYNGIQGLQRGEFIKLDKNISIKDITAVPIALPMIAGPATITAAVTFPAHYGYMVTIISIVAALVINFFFMHYARKIGNGLNRINLMNSLIRIFGLIVATIGVQMVLTGVGVFIEQLNV
ncbi:MarC family protein [Saccharicrinis sp. FJH2]|uniref:MarC family protein n=1 Tax=Saccharicrinis sp. FJH65 TaxID=3344659 RepID=UPI0035F2F0C5